MFNWTKLKCAGKLGNCPKNLTRFRFTCLSCRWRRRFYGRYHNPPFWIEYTYKSFFYVVYLKQHVRDDGLIIEASNGSMMKVTKHRVLFINPRGHFTGLRCAIIVWLDCMIGYLHIKKPLLEFCEFFANYPTW
ncbi:MAG: hypothetical protein OEZ40_01650 [Candidatus Bathyarchaeota archaeon]|nr:hypothetical protein [Candidatus Bathyarchaeota archaeon]